MSVNLSEHYEGHYLLIVFNSTYSNAVRLKTKPDLSGHRLYEHGVLEPRKLSRLSASLLI